MGLDHGTRRIGVAVGDEETGIAFARPALRRTGGGDTQAVADLAAQEEARLIVLGLPLNMDGSEGPQARTVRRFGAALSRHGLEVVYSDERLTSWAAGEELAAGGGRSSPSAGGVDSAAACLILQQYLDAQTRRPHVQRP